MKITKFAEPSEVAGTNGSSVGGDTSGSVPGPITVVGLNGTPVSDAAPSTGDALIFNGSEWEPAVNTPFGPAGGDLSGTYPNPTISPSWLVPGKHTHIIGEPMVGDGSTTVFYLAAEAEPDSAQVWIDGVLVDATLDSDTITFDYAPDDGAAIRANYLAMLGA